MNNMESNIEETYEFQDDDLEQQVFKIVNPLEPKINE